MSPSWTLFLWFSFDCDANRVAILCSCSFSKPGPPSSLLSVSSLCPFNIFSSPWSSQSQFPFLADRSIMLVFFRSQPKQLLRETSSSHRGSSLLLPRTTPVFFLHYTYNKLSVFYLLVYLLLSDSPLGCKLHELGPSLVAQWLKIRLPMQGTWVRALVQEDPTCHRATKPLRHNYWACTLEPASHNYWAHVPQLLKPVPRAHAL